MTRIQFIRLFLLKNMIMHLIPFLVHLRSVSIIVMGLIGIEIDAQTHCVIIDKETGVPLRNVKVYTDRGEMSVTNYLGQLTLDSVFNSATISHVSYLSRVVRKNELRDTVWLLPKENRLAEVVVWGVKQRRVNMVVKDALEKALQTATPPPSGISFDFARLIEKKPLSRKARKKNEQILSNWDRLYNGKEK